MSVFQVPVTFDNASRRKDRSVGLRFTTLYEVTNGDFAVADQFHGARGWLLFSEQELTEDDIPDAPLPDDSTPKTSSQRLRASLFVVWRETNESLPWETFYRHRMEQIIEDVKREIPE